jgi:hypothetical protein
MNPPPNSLSAVAVVGNEDRVLRAHEYPPYQ